MPELEVQLSPIEWKAFTPEANFLVGYAIAAEQTTVEIGDNRPPGCDGATSIRHRDSPQDTVQVQGISDLGGGYGHRLEGARGGRD